MTRTKSETTKKTLAIVFENNENTQCCERIHHCCNNSDESDESLGRNNDEHIIKYVCSDCGEEFEYYKRRCINCRSVQVKFLCECGAFQSVSSIRIHDCDTYVKRRELKEQFKTDRKQKKIRWNNNAVL